MGIAKNGFIQPIRHVAEVLPLPWPYGTDQGSQDEPAGSPQRGDVSLSRDRGNLGSGVCGGRGARAAGSPGSPQAPEPPDCLVDSYQTAATTSAVSRRSPNSFRT